jgi:solute carrier family 50 protein (sugar transporter)
MMVVNAMAWMIYGMTIKDFYVFFPNVSGFCLGVYYTLSSYPYQTKGSQNNSALIIIGFGALTFLSSAIANIYISDAKIAQQVLGAVCVLILIVFYSSPLSTVTHIIRSQNAASVHIGLAIASLINGILWSIYGIVVNDWVPENSCSS